MEPIEQHQLQAQVRFDGGELDCGNGLLLLIRRHIDPLAPGQLVEILSQEVSVEEDLPAWCRLTGNQLMSWTKQGRQRSYLVSKGPFLGSASSSGQGPKEVVNPIELQLKKVAVKALHPLPNPSPVPAIPPLSVMGIGSWPRPEWMRECLHAYLKGSITEEQFSATADDAVWLAVDRQIRAGAQVISDGEQRRDSYASFVGNRLDNCQLIPLSDLAALVEDPDEFRQELQGLDVPADDVRHPVVFGPLGRSKPLATHEIILPRLLSNLPIKVALPGPYLLTRTLWLDCLNERFYQSREDLATDVVRVLREELHCLLAEGVALVQFDEPVLTEVVFSGPKNKRSFMCGALSERGDAGPELDFASQLLQELCRGVDPQRVGLHICRGNWTKDERALLSGSYEPLLPILQRAPVGTLFLEYATPRAGELELLRQIPSDKRVGLGLVNPKLDTVESLEELMPKARLALNLVGRERLLLNPDCGFATFADNPVTSHQVAAAKLAQLRRCADNL